MSYRPDGTFRYDGVWRQVRAAVLLRDGYECRIRGERCVGAACEVDHIVRPAEGGALYDPDNLRASCSWCNRSRGGKVAGRRSVFCPIPQSPEHRTPEAPCPECGKTPSRWWGEPA